MAEFLTKCLFMFMFAFIAFGFTLGILDMLGLL